MQRKLRLNVKTLKIPVVFHNLKGYDAHIIMQAMTKTEKAKELSCITKNMEKYIASSLGKLKIIDSCAFMAASLDSLVKGTPKESLKITEKLAKRLNGNFDLMVKRASTPTSTWTRSKSSRK